MVKFISYFTLILLFIVTPLRADIVDLWQFASEENEIRAISLAKQLRCPQCQNQNLVESTSPIARDLRLEVYRLVDEGKSNVEIIELMTLRFGDFVLYKPRVNAQTLLLWLAPFLMLVGACFYYWRYIRQRNTIIELSDEQSEQVQRLLKRQRQRT